MSARRINPPKMGVKRNSQTLIIFNRPLETDNIFVSYGAQAHLPVLSKSMEIAEGRSGGLRDALDVHQTFTKCMTASSQRIQAENQGKRTLTKEESQE